jgi:hypothetical protein
MKPKTADRREFTLIVLIRVHPRQSAVNVV